MAKLVHGYWEIRGLGQPIRLLLAYVGEDYEDKRYYTGPAPDYDKSEWLAEKFKLGLDFPNLPYVLDGDVKLTQTHAIMRYLGRKYKLVGTDENENIRCDLAEQQLADLRGWLVRLSYSPGATFEEMKPVATDLMKKTLTAFSKFLGDRTWMVGDRLTYVDFLCYEIFFQTHVFDKALFEGLDNLLAYNKRFEALPTIAAYMSSDKFIKWPFNNNMATFGSRTTPCPF